MRERERTSERTRARGPTSLRTLPPSLPPSRARQGRTAARAAWPVTSEDFLGIADAAAADDDDEERTIRASRGHC